MNSYDYNKGYVAGYEKACADMLSLIQVKVRETKGISPIDEMYGRGTYSEVVGAKGIPQQYQTDATGRVYDSYRYNVDRTGHVQGPYVTFTGDLEGMTEDDFADIVKQATSSPEFDDHASTLNTQGATGPQGHVG